MKLSLLILLLATLCMSLLPIACIYREMRGVPGAVVPLVVEDDHYYYARVSAVTKGYPQVGNPYFFEHREEIAPAFFIPDVVAAIPIFLGASFATATAFNFVFWSLVFSLCMYALFRKFDVSGSWSVAGSLFSFATSYSLILRPVIMQTVLPFFILFYSAFVNFLKKETPRFRDYIFLAVAGALPFYLYAYLWQIVVVTFGVTSFHLLWKKKFTQFKYLTLTCVGSIVLALPIIISTVKQINHPYYWETVMRIALVNTHVPTFFALYLVGVIGVFISLWVFFPRFVPMLQEDEGYKKAKLFSLLTGISLMVVLLSNVITGKDMEISNHIDRFVSLWAVLTLLLYIFYIYRVFLLRSSTWFSYKALPLFRKAFIALLCFLSLLYVGDAVLTGFTLPKLLRLDTKPQQEYSAPLKWLRENTPKQSVVWSNGSIQYYIPYNTENFQLFNRFGGLHLMTSQEVEERYLVSRYFNNLSVQDIQNDFRLYGGAGNALHQHNTHNRKVMICQFLKLDSLGISCGKKETAASFKGEEYFEDLHTQYTEEIRPHIADFLKKYNVSYIVIDKTEFLPKKIPSTQLVWENERFLIYAIIDTHQ